MHHDSSGGLEPLSTRDRTVSTLFFSCVSDIFGWDFLPLADHSIIFERVPSSIWGVMAWKGEGKGGRVGYR